jgi:hypothetical protein
MPDLTVSSAVDSFMQAANASAMRTALEIGDGSSAILDRTFAHPCRWDFFWSSASTSATVTGSGIANRNDFSGDIATGSTPSSRAQLSFPTTINSVFLMHGVGPNICDFSKRITAGFAFSWITKSTNGKFFLRIGANTSTSGDLSGRGFGICVADTTVVGQTHNGTSLNNSSTLATIGSSETVFVVIQSDGTGNVSFYINGTFVSTITGGPTVNGGNNFGISCEVLNGADSSSSRIQLSPVQIVREP